MVGNCEIKRISKDAAQLNDSKRIIDSNFYKNIASLKNTWSIILNVFQVANVSPLIKFNARYIFNYNFYFGG